MSFTSSPGWPAPPPHPDHLAVVADDLHATLVLILLGISTEFIPLFF